MAEKENLQHRVGQTVADNAKKIGFYLVIGIVSISVIFGAGILNLWKDLVEGQQEWLEMDADYMETLFDMLPQQYSDVNTAEDLLDLLQRLVGTDPTFYSAVDHYYIYDSATGEVIGGGDPARVQTLFDLSTRSMLMAKGWIYSVVPFSDRFSVVLDVSSAYVKDSLLSVLPRRLAELGAAILVYLLLLRLATAVFPEGKKRDRAVSVLLFLVLAVLITADAITATVNQTESYLDMESKLYEGLNKDMNNITALSDDTVVSLTANTDADAGRLQLVDLVIRSYSAMTYSVNYDSATVLDGSIPIRDRVQLTVRMEGFSNALLEYLLETVMYTVLAVILFWGIVYYKDDLLPGRRNAEDGSTLQAAMDRLKLMFTVKGFSDALTVTVTAKLLKSLLTDDIGSQSADFAVGTTVLVAAWIGIGALLVLPRVLKRIGGSAKLLPVSVTVYTVGSLLCFVADSSPVYILGYLMLMVGDTVYSLMRHIVPMELTPPDQDSHPKSHAISIGRRGGQIIGYVVGGTLVALFPYRTMFLISFVLSAVTIVPAIRIAGEPRQNPLPDKAYFLRTLKDRRIFLFLLLVEAPFAMVSYYFKYVVPLNVEAMGLTAALVSFLFFFRMLMKLVFKQEAKIRAMWKKLPNRTGVLVCMFSAAGIFVLMKLFNNVAVMILLTMLLALVEARYGGLVFKSGLGILGKDTEQYFGYLASAGVGTRFGKSLAAALTNGLGAMAIPAWMGGSAVCYLLATRGEVKKDPTQTGPQV